MKEGKAQYFGQVDSTTQRGSCLLVWLFFSPFALPLRNYWKLTTGILFLSLLIFPSIIPLLSLLILKIQHA